MIQTHAQNTRFNSHLGGLSPAPTSSAPLHSSLTLQIASILTNMRLKPKTVQENSFAYAVMNGDLLSTSQQNQKRLRSATNIVESHSDDKKRKIGSFLSQEVENLITGPRATPQSRILVPETDSNQDFSSSGGQTILKTIDLENLLKVIIYNHSCTPKFPFKWAQYGKKIKIHYSDVCKMWKKISGKLISDNKDMGNKDSDLWDVLQAEGDLRNWHSEELEGMIRHAANAANKIIGSPTEKRYRLHQVNDINMSIMLTKLTNFVYRLSAIQRQTHLFSHLRANLGQAFTNSPSNTTNNYMHSESIRKQPIDNTISLVSASPIDKPSSIPLGNTRTSIPNLLPQHSVIAQPMNGNSEAPSSSTSPFTPSFLAISLSAPIPAIVIKSSHVATPSNKTNFSPVHPLSFASTSGIAQETKSPIGDEASKTPNQTKKIYASFASDDATSYFDINKLLSAQPFAPITPPKIRPSSAFKENFSDFLDFQTDKSPCAQIDP